MGKIRKFWDWVESCGELADLLAREIVKALVWAILFATILLLVVPVCQAQDRHFVISDRPMSDGVIEVVVDEIPLDLLIRGMWDESPELSRGVIVVGDVEPPLVSVRFVGSVRDFDYALDEVVSAVGWLRQRTLRGVDVLSPDDGRSRSSPATRSEPPSRASGAGAVSPVLP